MRPKNQCFMSMFSCLLRVWSGHFCPLLVQAMQASGQEGPLTPRSSPHLTKINDELATAGKNHPQQRTCRSPKLGTQYCGTCSGEVFCGEISPTWLSG